MTCSSKQVRVKIDKCEICQFWSILYILTNDWLILITVLLLYHHNVFCALTGQFAWYKCPHWALYVTLCHPNTTRNGHEDERARSWKENIHDNSSCPVKSLWWNLTLKDSDASLWNWLNNDLHLSNKVRFTDTCVLGYFILLKHP